MSESAAPSKIQLNGRNAIQRVTRQIRRVYRHVMLRYLSPSRFAPQEGKRFHRRARRCHRQGCRSRAACFGFPGEKAVSCGSHRLNGMVNLDTCTGPDGILKRPAKAAKKRYRVRSGYCKSCTAPGCTRNATFGYGSSAGLRRRESCGVHKLPGMVDLAAVAESARETETRAQSSLRRAKNQIRGRGGGSGNGGSWGSDEGAEDDEYSEEDDDSDSDYEEEGWKQKEEEEEEEEQEQEHKQDRRQLKERARVKANSVGSGSSSGSQRRSGERCKAAPDCDKAATFGFPEGPCVSCSEHHQEGMLNLSFTYQNLPKRRHPSKRKRTVWVEEEEEEEEEEEVGVQQTADHGSPAAEARSGQPHARKKPRGAAGDGTAVPAGTGGGGDGGSCVGGTTAVDRVGVVGDSPGVDAAGVVEGDAPTSQLEDGWPPVVGEGGGGGEGGGHEAGDRWPVPMGVSDEACFEVSEDAAELWCHQDDTPTLEAPTKAKARTQVAMVNVKRELRGAAIVKQEEIEATGNGGQLLASADQTVLELGHAGGGNVAGAVDVKPDLTEGKATTRAKGCRGANEEDETVGAGAGAGAGEDGEPCWKWMTQAEAAEQIDGGRHEGKRGARCCYGGCQNLPRIGIYKLEGGKIELCEEHSVPGVQEAVRGTTP